MIVNRIRPRRDAKAAAGQAEGRRTRVGRYLVLIFGSGAIAGTAALAGIPPFGSFQAILGPINQILHPPPPPTPIAASALFPPVKPVHKVIDVYDPPAPARHASPVPQPPTTSPTPKPSPSPPLRTSPSPTPPGGD